MAGIGSSRNPNRYHFTCLFVAHGLTKTLARHRPNRTAGYLRVQNVRPAPALGRVLMDQLSSGQVIVLTDVLGQPAVY
jgi:hypothetical protein